MIYLIKHRACCLITWKEKIANSPTAVSQPGAVIARPSIFSADIPKAPFLGLEIKNTPKKTITSLKLTFLYLTFLFNLFLILFLSLSSPIHRLLAASLPSNRTTDKRLIGLSLIYSELPGSCTGPISTALHLPHYLSDTQLPTGQLSSHLKMLNCPICVEERAAGGSIDLLLSVEYSPVAQAHNHRMYLMTGETELLGAFKLNHIQLHEKRLTDGTHLIVLHWFTFTYYLPIIPPHLPIHSTLSHMLDNKGNDGGRQDGQVIRDSCEVALVLLCNQLLLNKLC